MIEATPRPADALARTVEASERRAGAVLASVRRLPDLTPCAAMSCRPAAPSGPPPSTRSRPAPPVSSPRPPGWMAVRSATTRPEVAATTASDSAADLSSPRRSAKCLIRHGLRVINILIIGGAIDLDLPTARIEEASEQGTSPLHPRAPGRRHLPRPRLQRSSPARSRQRAPIEFAPPRGRPGKLPAARGSSARAAVAGKRQQPGPHLRQTRWRRGTPGRDDGRDLRRGDQRASWRILRRSALPTRRSIAL
jgi:hypothetical protein